MGKCIERKGIHEQHTFTVIAYGCVYVLWRFSFLFVLKLTAVTGNKQVQLQMVD